MHDATGTAAESRASGGRSGRFPVDAHVHFHACFDPAAFLDAARANFRTAVGGEVAPDPLGVLVFVDARGQDGFERIDAALDAGLDGWSVARTEEPASCMARHAGGDRILLVAGRQIVTAEGLELLALGRAVPVADGLPLRDAVDVVHRADAVPVVPWGFGKWWGRRGRILLRMLDAMPRGVLCLGDNGGRPRGARRARLLRWADANGCPVLPGSDPLPFRRHEARAGSYGAWVRMRLDVHRPAASVRRRLHSLEASPRPFGRRTSWTRFVIDQFAMQMYARRPGRPRATERDRHAHSLH